MEHRLHRLTSFFEIALIVLFVGAVFVPLILTALSNPREESTVEMRDLTYTLDLDQKPLNEVVSQFETFLNDQIAFRESLVQLNNFIKFTYLNQSAVDRVIIGQAGWLFHDEDVDYYRHIEHFSPDELETIRLGLEARRDALAAEGITYLLVIAPNKSTIYTEYMPDQYTIVQPESALDQVFNYLNANSDVEFIDLRPLLGEAKTNIQTYYPAGTHWTSEATYLVYNAVLNQLKLSHPSLTPPIETDITSRYAESDLTALLGLPASTDTIAPLLSPAEPCAQTQPYTRFSNLSMFSLYSTCPEAELSAVIFHDSFFDAVNPFLREHFRESIALRPQYYDYFTMQTVMEDIQPQIVVEEMVERYLRQWLLPSAEQAIGDWNGVSQFNELANLYRFEDETSSYDSYTIVGATATPSANGLRLDVPASRPFDPQMVFTIPTLPVGETLALRLEITVPACTTIQVFYADSTQNFSEGQSERVGICDTNEIYITIENTIPISYLRLDPGSTRGAYILHELEIRGSY